MMKKFPFDVDVLKKWFKIARRELPWRNVSDPYAIWISEIMLQQTQVSVVEDYYSRWMSRFPTISALASASLEEVIKMWEGLGYYSRARHLHEAAHLLMENYEGKLPSTKEELAKIKGLGPYTIGAILSFAFHQKAAAVDGNSIRVLTRYYGVEDDIQKSKTIKKIWEIAESILPEDEPWLVVEGLIELGATVCKKDPSCDECPLQETCFAYEQETQRQIPKKGKKIETTILKRQVFVIVHDNKLLVKKGRPRRVMADLYEFPYFEKVTNIFPFSFEAKKIKNLAEVEHCFTRFKARLYPTLWKAVKQIEIPDHDWISLEHIEKYPFSSGHKKILNFLKLELYCDSQIVNGSI